MQVKIFVRQKKKNENLALPSILWFCQQLPSWPLKNYHWEQHGWEAATVRTKILVFIIKDHWHQIVCGIPSDGWYWHWETLGKSLYHLSKEQALKSRSGKWKVTVVKRGIGLATLLFKSSISVAPCRWEGHSLAWPFCPLAYLCWANSLWWLFINDSGFRPIMETKMNSSNTIF